MSPLPDPALEAAARTLPDPDSLTRTQARAVRLARTQRLVMVRGGWKAGTHKISFKSTEILERLNLVRRVLDRGRWTLVCTGAGMALLDIIDQRTNAKKEARS